MVGLDRRRPGGVVLVVTSACNLRCSYCYQDRHPPRRMAWETAKAALDFVLAYPSREVAIGFGGGEPLLAFDLVRRVVEEAERRVPPGTRLSFGLTTNGLLLDADVAAFLDAHGVETRLSLDGVRAAQDLRAPGTFDRLGPRLRDLRHAHPGFYRDLLEVAITVTPENVKTLDASVGWMLSRGIRTIVLAPATLPAWTFDREQERELHRQLARTHQRSLAFYRRTGRVPLTLFRRRPGHALPPRGPLCGVGRTRLLTVDVDGGVCGCSALVRSSQSFSRPGLHRWIEPLRIGPLGAPRLGPRLQAFRRRVARSPLFNGRARKHSSRRRCAECRHRATCAICPVAIAYASDDDPHRIPDFLCAFHRISQLYRERFPPQLDLPEPDLAWLRPGRQGA
jgi:sulfatase maturation enzyme AslB (radical SAM superfamily)